MAFMKKAAPAAAEFRVRSLAEASKEYGELLAKRQEFIDRKGQLDRERVALGQIDFHAFEVDSRRARVESLVTGYGDLAELPASPRSAYIARFSEIDRQIADIKSARELIDQKLVAARNKASAVIVEEVRPEYGERIAALCKGLVAVYETSRSLEALKSDLNAKDIAWGALNPISAESLNHRLGQILNECARAGFIAATDVPERLR
jgi:hypothetical protein